MRFTASLRLRSLPLAVIAPMLWFALAASPAAATEEEDLELFGCQVNAAIGGLKASLCTESKFNCELTEEACAGICEEFSERCQRANRAASRVRIQRIRSQMRVFHMLCRHAEDRDGCREFAKQRRAASLAVMRQARRQGARVCRNAEVQATCNDVCYNDASVPSCPLPPPSGGFVAPNPPRLEFELFQPESPPRPQEGAIIIAVGADETLLANTNRPEELVTLRLTNDVPLFPDGTTPTVLAFESQAELDAFLAQRAEEND